MLDAEIREMLREKKAIEKKAKAEMNREMLIGAPLLLGCFVWVYLISALPL